MYAKASKKVLSKIFVSDNLICNDINDFFHSLRPTSIGKAFVKSIALVVFIIGNIHTYIFVVKDFLITNRLNQFYDSNDSSMESE